MGYFKTDKLGCPTSSLSLRMLCVKHNLWNLIWAFHIK